MLNINGSALDLRLFYLFYTLVRRNMLYGMFIKC